MSRGPGSNPRRPPFSFGLDIETDNSEDHGLDPMIAAVTSIAVWSESAMPVVLDDGTEESKLERFAALMNSLRPGICFTWNGDCFDAPYLAVRAALCGVKSPVRLAYDETITPKYGTTFGRPGGYRARIGRHRHVDVSPFYRDFADEAGVKWKLKPVAEAAGLKPIQLDAANLHLYSPVERRAYNLSDARVTCELGLRLEEEGRLAEAA